MQTNGACTDGLMEDLDRIDPHLTVTLRNGSVLRRNLLKDFIVLKDTMRPEDDWIEDAYTLYEKEGFWFLPREFRSCVVFLLRLRSFETRSQYKLLVKCIPGDLKVLSST
ncbi:probable G-protein coupled receptor Mth-like 6 [Drosophila kikkawai]|uniref:Probable G-protein coupled receptor Mth-like 6 n=1 Tax=Drosophila kikkawai TaxID=30033 RepID=A0ABM4GL40_DROKI